MTTPTEEELSMQRWAYYGIEDEYMTRNLPMDNPNTETKLTTEEINLIIEALRYTRQAFEKYEYYPSREFRQERLDTVDTIKSKLVAMKRGTNGAKK